jgi:hypothetical protein
VRIERNRLVLTPLSAEEPLGSSAAHQEKITRHLPRVDPSDLLIEVDGWAGFNCHFEYAGGREPRASAHFYDDLVRSAGLRLPR